jgi:O-antigen/teichoic acid export membrane protein
MADDNGNHPLDHAALRHRASAGMFIVGSRGVVVLVLGLAGNIVVARLLTPHDFGVVAIGMTFVSFVAVVSDGGLGAGLIRRPEPPRQDELGALLALQLVLTVVLAAAATAVADPFGQSGYVVAVMMWSMPIVTLQFAGRILLERELRYRPLAMVEVSQVLAFQLGSVVLVVAGAGVWGIAAATVLRAMVGSALIWWVCPAGRSRPRISWRLLRPLLGFGIRLQAVHATLVVRDQGLNAAIAAVGGVTMVGLVSMVRRVLEIPYLLFQSLWRVSFPTMSQLVAANKDPARLMERAVAVTAVGSGVILVGLVGSAPGLVPGVFGEQWRPAVEAIPLACLGLGIAGSISVATQGFLYAVGDASAVLRSVVYQTITAFAVTLPLLGSLGVGAFGVGVLASSLVESAVLVRATSAKLPVRLTRHLVAPILVGSCAATVGWRLARGTPGDLVGAGIGGSVAIVIFVLGMTMVRRQLMADTVSVAMASTRAALRDRRGEPLTG